MVKNLPANAEDMKSIPGAGRSLEGGNDNLFQYSCLENSMDRGARWATVHGVAKSRTWLSTHTQCIYANHNIWMGETKLMKMNLEKMLPNMRRNHVIFFCPHSLALLKTTSIWGECFRISQSKHHHFLYKSHFHFALKHWDTLGGGELGEENERRGQRVGERPVGKVKGLRGGGGSMDFLQEKLAHHQRLTKEEYDFSVQKDLSEMNGNFVSNCCCCCSVCQSCQTLCSPMNCSS